MKKFICLFLLMSLFFSWTSLLAQEKFTFAGAWGGSEYFVESQDASGIQIRYSVPAITLNPVFINGKNQTSLSIPGVFLPNEAGAPNLPASGRFIAIPQGATAHLEVLSLEKETITGIEIAPAPVIPKETEEGLDYPVNQVIYGQNSLYPAKPLLLSEPTQIRGMDMVMLGITPFQYNPVTKELVVFKNIRVKVTFEGGNGHFGNDRLRSRWFDPLLQDMVLNPGMLPVVNYNKTMVNTEDEGYEYLIIVPNADYFSQWADSIKTFRTRQGIITGIKTFTDIGGNSTSDIENYIDNAYNNWSIPPVAVLLIGDYGNDPDNTMLSPIYNSYCVSDNIYGDVNNDNLPDIVMARMTAQDAAQLEVMVRKFIDYERNPPVSADFYAHPITALGWQTERWFQVCSEVIQGFWQNALGKTPVRINEVYDGDPSVDPWSTATNTADVISYFGPGGLEYIPATPQALGNWTGGNASQINAAINEGSFMLQHRDHGGEDGWGEPVYLNGDIDGLTNTDLCFIMSVNCLTGKYNSPNEVFAEKFHRYTYTGQPSGALGILAASEVSYSFVNDAFIWGAYDNMWPEFMPSYGSTPAERGILPAFGNAAGKFFLEQSSWPYNTSDKEVTYNLFHHHGDAFLSVYSEVPQALTVVHDPIIYTGVTSFNVTANSGALICLSLNGEILGTGTGTGSPVSITIPGNQLPPEHLDVVVTLQNFYRYEAEVPVIPPTGPYVVKYSYIINDIGGNNNGKMDYGEPILLTLAVKNVGIVQASNITVTLSSSDPYITIYTSSVPYGEIPANSILSILDGFTFVVSGQIPDNHMVGFQMTATDGITNWISYFSIKGHAPKLNYQSYTLSDVSGNGNGKLDPGETVSLILTMKNTGSADAYNVEGLLQNTDGFITLNDTLEPFGDVASGSLATATYSVTAGASTPTGSPAQFTVDMAAGLGITGSGSFEIIVGQIPILIVDLSADTSSSLTMQAVVQNLGLTSAYHTSLPVDLTVYSCIFVNLGIYDSNHQLTSPEGQALADYLLSGGRLYMEGGDTWAYDSPTPVHPYFNIHGIEDGSGDLGTIEGEAGTFTAGMSFSYSGSNSWIDRIEPLGGTSAFQIFHNLSPVYGTGVAFDGGTYRTIGCSHAFGGLDEGTFPATKAELMTQYLIFFGILTVELTANFTVSNTNPCQGTNVVFSDNSAGAPVSWTWSFPGGNPSSSTNQNPNVTYSSTGTYDVTLVVSDGSHTDTLTKTSYIQVNGIPGQAATPTGPASICNNTAFTHFNTTGAIMASTYSWTMLPANAGVISGTTTQGTAYWNVTYSGPVTIAVTGVNACGNGIPSGDFPLEMRAIPVVSLADFNSVCISWPAFPLSGGLPSGGTYSGTGVNNDWFDPAQVVPGYHSITYTFTDTYGCSAFASKSIFVDACTQVQSAGPAGFSVDIFPNPSQSHVQIIIYGMDDQSVQFTVTTVLGAQILKEDVFLPDGKASRILETHNWPKGVYFLGLESRSKKIIRKILVE